MRVSIDCPCGSQIDQEGDGEGVADLQFDCGACGRAYVATVTVFSGPG